MQIEYTQVQKDAISEKLALMDTEIIKIQEQMQKYGLSDICLELFSNPVFRFSKSSINLVIRKWDLEYCFFKGEQRYVRNIHSLIEVNPLFGADLIRNWQDVKQTLYKILDERMLGITNDKIRDVELQDNIDTYLENFTL